jgi:hypothetical protein
MTEANIFPIPFKSIRTMSGGKDRGYVVGAMFTAAYFEKAERLAASCERFGLPYALHEVPNVHQSISARGNGDLSYTKANFIRHMLSAHGKSVLYVDADCTFAAAPELIDQLARSRCDFAIYNWYADEYTDRFIPVELSPAPGQSPIGNRFYRFAGSVDWFTHTQLGCSGLVQFYNNSAAARTLLARWHRTIETFPGCSDDAALTFAFNNLGWISWLMKVRWLPKSYARISYWIHTKPVIDHPDPYVPGKTCFTAIRDPRGRKVIYRSRMVRRVPALLFPRDCIIDTEKHMLCRLTDGNLIPVESTEQEFWLGSIREFAP